MTAATHEDVRDAVIEAASRPRKPVPAMVNATGFAAMIGITYRTFKSWEESGRIGPAPVMGGDGEDDGRKLWSRVEIERWLVERDAGRRMYNRETWPAAWDAINAAARGRRRAKS